jgi:PAS domain S-box-containing protein
MSGKKSTTQSAADLLRKSEERFRAVLDAVEVGISLIDSGFNILSVNRKQAEIVDRHPEELIGRKCYAEYEGREAVCPHCPGIKAMASGDAAETDAIGRCGDGSAFAAHLKASPICDAKGRASGFVAVTEDTRERKQAEEARLESEQRFRTVVEASPDAIALTELDGRLLMANRQMARFFGFDDVEELLASGTIDFQLLVPEDRQRARENMNRLIDKGVLRDVEYTGCRRDGSRFPLEVSGALERDAQGSPKAVIIVLRDITVRKRGEQDLIHARRAAEETNRAKSAFLANVSHEIRTPMTAILGFSELLAVPDLPHREQCELLDGIRRNGKALLQLIGDILDLSRLEAAKLTLAKTDCLVRQIVDDTLSTVRIRAQKKRLSLEVDYRQPLPERIYTDPVRLRQVLGNLLGNAVKFTERGGVRMAVRCLGDTGDGRRLQFAVSDSGVGIPAEKMGQLFQPFTQLDGSATRRHGGTGLGLAISQRLAELLGGRLEVASQWGQGSTFTLTIDAGAPSAAMAEPPRRAEPSPRQPEPPLRGRLLLVEDAPDLQQLVRLLLLRKTGLEVEVASSGPLACAMAETSKSEGRPYDVILMDIQMPAVDGHEAAGELRRRGWTGTIIAMTAYALAGDREKWLAAGCDDHIAKPLLTAGLYEVLTRHLGKPRTAMILP